MVEGRCMRCKKMVEIQNGTETTTKNGTLMLKGKCPLCPKRTPPQDTTVCRILGRAKK